MTREQLEAMVHLHLSPAMERLHAEGVVVTVIVQPLQGTADGRAVIASNEAASIEQMGRYLEGALDQVRGRGRHKPFQLRKN